MFSANAKDSAIRRLCEILLHFIFPVSCPVCGKPGVKICPECRKYQLDDSQPGENISDIITPHVHTPDIPDINTHTAHTLDISDIITPPAHTPDIPDINTHTAHTLDISDIITPPAHTPDSPARILPTLFSGEVITKNINGLTVYSAAKYHEDRIQETIYRLKYKGMRELGRPLGRYMAQFFGQCRADVLIPVPLHLYSTRGYNQSKELAEGMRDFWGVEILDAALWTRDVPRRATTNIRSDLTYEDFRLTRDISGKRIALVDDVCTSGNTLSCLAETCLREDAVVVCAYTLAST